MDGLRTFRTISMASFAAILVGAISAGAVIQTQKIPPILTDRDGQTFWVSAQRVVDEGPELLRRLDDPRLFQVGWLLRALADPGAVRSPLPGRNDCLQYLDAVANGGVFSLAFDEQVISRTTILVGTVLDSTDGLAWGSPHTMLLLAVDRWLKKPADMAAFEQTYASYKSGRVEIAGVSACRPRGEELPPAPPIGAPVLAMFYRGPFKYSVAGEPLFVAGHTLMYDGLQDGQPTLMASDELLEGSPEWLIDATVAGLAERADRILASPDEFAAPAAPSPPPTPPTRGNTPAERGDPPADRPPRQPDPPDPCLRTEQCLVTPLALASDVFSALTSSINGSTTLFDIDGDGRPERTAWLLGDSGDAFLWMDLNGNGAVDGSHEFVGAPGTDPRTDPPAIESSFEILALYDEPRHGGNGDGRIDGDDRVWDRLLTWADRNSDGISAPHEISPAGERVVYFDLAYELVDDWDGSMNRVLGRALFWVRGLRRDLRPREVSERALKFR